MFRRLATTDLMWPIKCRKPVSSNRSVLTIPGKSHRKDKNPVTQHIPCGHSKDHSQAHDFNNLLIEGTRPLVLWKFQEFLKNLDPKIVRVKGKAAICHLLSSRNYLLCTQSE